MLLNISSRWSQIGGYSRAGACCPTPGTTTIGSICQLTIRAPGPINAQGAVQDEDRGFRTLSECRPSKPQSRIITRLLKPVRGATLDWCANDAGTWRQGMVPFGISAHPSGWMSRELRHLLSYKSPNTSP
jgi:hypothetical protein